MRQGVAVVTNVVNVEPMDLGGHVFRVSAGAEPRIILIPRGTALERKNASTVGGPVAANGATGDISFTGFGPRARLPSFRDRLGGAAGPELLDGSVEWDCGAQPAGIPDEPA
jgi:hypothetical protein